MKSFCKFIRKDLHAVRSLFLLACASCASGGNSWAQSLPESSIQSVRLTLHPNSIAVGDFNRDGNLLVGSSYS